MGCDMKIVTYLLLFLCISFPYDADAAHRFRGVDRSDLDTKPVETFPVPVLFGIPYTSLVADFGDARGDGTRTHEGQDMLAPLGTPIVSPTDAIVIRTGTGESAGKYVYTANPGGETFRYMHLDYSADLDPGDVLKPGDFIGTVGDTGNAPEGVYHLHFEVRDKSNEATDPFPRLSDEFTLKEKMSFLRDILRDVDDADEYAKFLVDSFTADFESAVKAGYTLPDEIEVELDARGVYSEAKARAKLEETLRLIPQVLTSELTMGQHNALVVLLQIYVLYMTDGAEARAQLLAAGPTGYYGNVTMAAISEYQASHSLTVTGVYDAATRAEMLTDGGVLQL